MTRSLPKLRSQPTSLKLAFCPPARHMGLFDEMCAKKAAGAQAVWDAKKSKNSKLELLEANVRVIYGASNPA